MLKFSIKNWATGFVIWGICSVALAQKPTDYLYVQNNSPEPIWVAIRPHGRDTPWDKEYKIDGTPVGSPTIATVQFPLHDGEPFDISIRQGDGTYSIMYQVPLCTWMRRCVKEKKPDWIAHAVIGQYIKNENGKKTFEKSGEYDLPAIADENQVTIPYYHLVGKSDPRPLPKPPPLPNPIPTPPPVPST